MSLDTTIAQAAARDAEAAWNRHRKTCATCGRRLRDPAAECAQGAQLANDAREARQAARAAKAADDAPGPGDVPLFDAAELGGPWLLTLQCGHQIVSENPAKPNKYNSCLPCQGQRRIISVTAGQGNA